MNKQAYLNEVMSELRKLNVDDRYERIRHYIKEIDEAFDAGDIEHVYQTIGTPKAFAIKIQTANVKTKKTFAYHNVKDSNASFEEILDDSENDTTSEYDKESKKTENEQFYEQVHNKRHNAQNDGQFTEPFSKKVGMNKIFAIIIAIVILKLVFEPWSPIGWTLGFLGLPFAIIFGSLRIIFFIVVIFLCYKLFTKNK